MADELFCKVVSIGIKCRECEDRRANVRLTVESRSSSNPVHKKELIVRLSDDTDPFFLYNLTLGEEDFQSLKNQQGLLVEFSAFPQRFIDLLEQCILEQDKPVPRFLLQLVTSLNALDCMPASLNIIETNPFKHLIHLSLKLLAGSDSDVKKYLATCIKNLKLENCTLKEKLQKSEEELSKRLGVTQQALADKCKELDKLRNEWASQTSLLTSKHTQEISAEREKALQVQSQYQLQYEQQKKELETTSSRTIQHLESRVSELEAVNKDLTERKYKSESCIRELKGKLSGMEEEYHRTKQEVTSLRRENATLDSECHEKEKLINQLKTRTAVLEQEVKDKEQVIIRSVDACESAQEHKKKLEDSLDQKQVQTGKLETTVKSLSEELIKANEIIKKLQTDMKKLMEKIKLKNAVTMQQEKLLGEKEQTLQKEKLELTNIKHTLKMKEEEMLKLKEQLDSTTEKLEESKQLLKTNENVIAWLNKQLNENKIAALQGTHGLHEMPGSLKAVGIASNAGVMQTTQPPFSVGNNPYMASTIAQPIGPALVSNIYSKNFTPGMSAPSPVSLGSRLNPHAAFQVRFNQSSPAVEPRPVPSTSTPILPSTSCDPVGLDMKYLKKNGSVPVKGQKNGSSVGTVPVRPALPKSGSSPILSAYFPGQHSRLPAS
ncbi:spindle assembly 6 homolog [Xenopus tropicalis]|uniref:Spindle assembly abnormal protein 6 homolog n=1 Tax=Xenopus tropicalis TaxID=8364 RepID=Q28C08_XENTR|nr:spindle assembly 6 homolog [Xenopus tropicalis]CAJ81485.1 spindle assembly abnormal protein 6 (SAS-6) [Xenopus tropicalis]|eukprot:NP_001039141.1 spindle assembly 6 homolog [Xenopus tropicalis]